MSFDQYPHEQANISAADFAIMCDEMKELKLKVSQLESIISECRDAAGFGTVDDHMNVTGCGALGMPEEVPAFIKDQFDRLRNERQWQPINTAPKDETFLAVIECGGYQTICTMRGKVAEAKNSLPKTGEFIRDRVTHWMPLPEAPKHQD